MVPVISDESIFEVFTEDDIFKTMGRGIYYYQISIIYWIVQALKIRVKRTKDKSWICQICNKQFYGWNDIKENFHIDCYQQISDI